MKRRVFDRSIAVAFTLLMVSSGAALAAGAAPEGLAPLPAKLIGAACKLLSSSDAYSFHAEIMFDHVLESDVKVQFAAAMDFYLQKPGELAVDYRSDLGGKQLWYHDGQLTIFDPPQMVYATMNVPGTIDGMVEHAAIEHGLTFPMAEFALSDPCKAIASRLVHSGYIGRNDVNGVECDHLAFMGREADLQVWLDRSGKPVPRKIVINYRTVPGSPEYIAFLSDWKFPEKIPASRFHPDLPSTAKKIDFLPLKEGQP
jgi:hypothetical protein